MTACFSFRFGVLRMFDYKPGGHRPPLQFTEHLAHTLTALRRAGAMSSVLLRADHPGRIVADASCPPVKSNSTEGGTDENCLPDFRHSLYFYNHSCDLFRSAGSDGPTELAG